MVENASAEVLYAGWTRIETDHRGAKAPREEEE